MRLRKKARWDGKASSVDERATKFYNRKRMKIRTLILIFPFLFIPFSSRANLTSVFISEIAWMGTSSDTTNEWLELYNPTSDSVSLDGWMLVSADGSPSIHLSGSVGPHSFFLLERTDDDTVPDKSANEIYTGALNNTGEALTLSDSYGSTIDLFPGGAWPAGSNADKTTMERMLDGLWATSAVVGGTPQGANSVWIAPSSPPQPPPAPTPTPPPPPPSPETEPTSPPPPTQPTQEPQKTPYIFISELLPNPAGTDSQLEFVELINSDSASFDISGWSLSDGTSTFTVPSNTVLGPGEYRAFFATQTHISLNNDGDAITLKDASGASRDGIEYTSSTEGFSLSKLNSAWLWTPSPTPGKENSFEETVPTDQEKDAPVTETVLQKAPEAPSAQQNNDSSRTVRTKTEHSPVEPSPADSFPAPASFSSSGTGILSLFGALAVGLSAGGLAFFLLKRGMRK